MRDEFVSLIAFRMGDKTVIELLPMIPPTTT
jgi:hypothetical protein